MTILKSPRTSLGLFALLATWMATATSIEAQILAPAQPATTAAAGDQEIILLSPFTVSSAGDEGYRAQNTLAGSRLNSSLNDTPGVLDVLTKDFLDDIGALTLEQALAFSANFEVDNGDFEAQGVINTIFAGPAATPSFRTRGLVGSLARNYLETDFRPGFYTIERIDNASGPNSVLFGLGSAGGVANVSTKAAKLNRNAYGLDFLTDGFRSKQVTLDLNQVLRANRVALRVNAISSRLNKYRAHFADNIDGVQLASTWRASERTEVQVEFERAHVTGSVAYPVPHIDQASRWLALGSPVATLPVGWESLTAAARTAVATPLALAANAVTVAPVLVDNPGYSYILNSATAISGTTTAGGLNRQTINPALFTPRGNINGPGGRKEVDRQILAVSINQKLSENLHVNLSAAREYGSAETWQAYANGAAGGAAILGDANATLPNAAQIATLGATRLNTNAAGQVINPFAGQFYTQSRWVRRLQSNERAIVQATGALQVNLGRWLGDHRVVGTASFSERVIASESQRDSWLNAPFAADPVNTVNGVMRRRYASPLDADNFHVPDYRNFPSLKWNHPTLGPITTGWVTETPARREARQIAYLGAVQSHFFNRRLVTTAGYRVDEATDYVFQTKRVFPAGFERSTGIAALDPANVRKSSTRGPTRTLGAVLHVTSWVSAYGNFSSNFGSPRGTVVGPDAVVGPTTQGRGLDTGLKFTLWSGKVYLDVGYFDTSSNDETEILNLNLRTNDSIAGAYNTVFTVLGNPAGRAPLFNANDAAAVNALKTAYPLLRPTFNAQGDLLDQASRGYEARLTANPFKGMRLRATYSKTDRQRENLYKFTGPMAEQLRAYIDDVQRRNPGVDVGGLSTAADPTTIAESLNNLDERLDLASGNNSTNYGGGGFSLNLAASYDFQQRLQGFGATATALYKSGAYTGVYEIREGGVSSGKLIGTKPLLGESTLDLGVGLRYRTRLAWLRRTAVTFQLNVTNLLDETEPVIRRTGNPRRVVAPGAPEPAIPRDGSVFAQYFLREPRTWNLSAKFQF
jgi:outer membrane receptor protein involved in Fe transport